MVRLPVEYQEVEYLESDGGKYLNLPYGFLDTDEVELVCEVHATGNDKYMISPSVWNNNNNRFAMAGNYSAKVTVGFGDLGTRTASERFNPGISLDALKHTWQYKNRLFTMLDGDTQIASCNVNSVNFGGETNYLRLFYGYNASTAGRVYSFKQIKQSGESLNLIPCYRKSDNEPGMYDTVTKQFFTNQGTGTFIVGNDVSWDTASLIERRRQMLLNTPHLSTISDTMASFKTDVPALVKDCKVYFTPVQEGTGDPSPENVRPISGWDEIELYHSGKNLFPLTLPSTAFAGTFGTDASTISSASSARVWTTYVGKNQTLYYQHGTSSPTLRFAFSDVPLTTRTGAVIYDALNCTSRNYVTLNSTTHPYIVICVANSSSLTPDTGSLDNASAMLSFGSGFKEYAKRTDILKVSIQFPQTIYGGYVDLAKGEVVETVGSDGQPITPQTHTITPETIKTLKGVNNIWSTGDSIQVSYWTH